MREPRYDPAANTWRCCRCERPKPRELFHGATPKPHPYCKACNRVYLKLLREHNGVNSSPEARERRRAAGREYARRHRATIDERMNRQRSTPIGRLMKARSDAKRRARLNLTEQGRERARQTAAECERMIAVLRRRDELFLTGSARKGA